ncbi:hypothetical protein SAMN05444422_104255 [Halobiforma haloterrestris]|uniref:Uncharacterized protein n=2 Tax=Natronobacterium TaxID=2256 RepID=M0LTZ4_NATLA|nr:MULTISPECIES: hypothetical protein [Halobiforma]EMA35560.1 hypothetical protein C445_04988 [Halobiforma lacisalsi AJ5]SFC09844.1 hypothetical protein SAMN05444422_104255 [Halobiforma haloterrestris]
MTGDDADHGAEYHLREALRHLNEARETGDLRKTNDVALEEVSDTVASVLNEYDQDGQ